jgi:hypothetical protein
LQRGEALGIATPANRVLWALVRLLEAKNSRILDILACSQINTGASSS